MSFRIKDFLPQTLFGRSLLIIMTPVLLLQLLATYVFYDRHWTRMTDRLATAIVGEISIIMDAIESSDTPELTADAIAPKLIRDLDIVIRFDPEVTQLPSGHISGWRPRLVTEKLNEQLNHKFSEPFNVYVGANERWIRVAFLLTDGLLTVSIPERRLYSSSSYIFLLWMAGLSMILFAIAIIFMRNQIRPIRKLAIAADWFGKGRDVANYKPEGAREVRQAAKAFLTMRERIKRQISQRTEMLAGVSHDLRTPLTRLKLELEMLDQNEDINAMRADIEDMEQMIEGYLDFARGDGQEEPELTDIQVLLEKIQKDAKRQNIEVSLDLKTQYPVSAWIRVQAMTRALMNLITNAERHAKTISVSFEANMPEQEAVIIIDDDGEGIAAEYREEVFKPFYRIEASRNKKTGGVGLGLSIAMDVVHGHGGIIKLEDSPLGGLRVRITLPL